MLSALRRLPAARAVLALAVAGAGLACRRGEEPAAALVPAGGARRIVSLAPSLTEIAFAIGAGDRLVGVDDYVEFPEQAKRLPRCGGLLNPNIERVLSLEPDLVMMLQTFRAADRIAAASIRIAVIPNESLADLDAAIARVGEELGAGPAAARLRARLKADLGAVAAQVAGKPRPRVAFVLDRRPGTLTDLYVAGRRSFLAQLVEAAGGQNAFADVNAGAARVGVEEMLRRAPEIVLDATRGEDPALAWAALTTLPAVKSGRILSVAADKVTVPGPRTGEAARRIAALLHPEIHGGG